MNVNLSSMMQQEQARKMDGSGQGMGRMMRETITLLPEDTQADVKSLMQTLDPAGKKEAMSKMAQIETSNMTVEDLTVAILDIFQPTQEAKKSSYPSSFSVYA